MTEVLKNHHALFDLLPEEMVINTLIFVDANTLINCRLVCKGWQKLIDTYVFKEKASRENKFVNNGQGYYSFSQISSNDVGRLELPWYVFYVISKYDPFNRNLVKNHCGQNGLKHWKCIDGFPHRHIQRYGGSWIIEKIAQSALLSIDDSNFDGYSSCFTSNGCCIRTKRQNIKFKDYGLNDTIMKTLQPEISFSAWYNNGCHWYSSYILQALLRNRSKQVIDSYFKLEVLIPDKNNLWNKISYSFKTKGNESYITLAHHIQDKKQYPHSNPCYNFKISCSVVKVLLPLRFKSAELKINI